MILGLALIGSAPVRAADDGFKPLFNGHNLDGWVHVNDAPGTWRVEKGEIITTGRPIGFLRTEKQYENFIVEFEWKHVPPAKDAAGNSGMFVWADPLPAVGTGAFARAIEVQVLVNLEWKDKKSGGVTASSHGDIFSIWGAKCVPDRPHPLGWERCIPLENRAKGAGEWNKYRIEGKDGRITLSVNGKAVSGVSKCNPRKGYLALEAEGSECHFRNLRIKELPSTNPKPNEVAMQGHDNWVQIYNRRNLGGWKVEDGHKNHWKPLDDWRLGYDGKSTAKDQNLWTTKSYGDFEMYVDWRLPSKPKKVKSPRILPSGEETREQVEVDDAGDSGIYLRGNSKSQVNIWCQPVGSGEVYGYRTDKSMSPEVRKGVTPKKRADKPVGQWNRFHIIMKGDRLTVYLNGVLVIDNAELPGVPKTGPLALQHHGDAVEFANVYVRELK
jgi:hypothetical protein